MQTTKTPKLSELDKKWYLIDMKGKTLGKAATLIANILRGKNKACFTPHLDCGDYVIVINANELKVTGRKEEQKQYYTHSGFPSGLKTTSLKKMLVEKPTLVIENAVSGMLPKNRLKKDFMKKLKVYADSNHKHEAQQPIILDI